MEIVLVAVAENGPRAVAKDGVLGPVGAAEAGLQAAVDKPASDHRLRKHVP